MRTSAGSGDLASQLGDLRIFTGVAPEVVGRLAVAGRARALAANEIVLEQGDTHLRLFVLTAGSVKVGFTSPETLEVVIKLFRAPAVFGEMECLTDIPYQESVWALEPARVIEFPARDFLAALDASPTFTRNLLNDVAARLCIAASHQRALAFNPVEMRLANVLLSYADAFGVPVADGTMIRIPLSQDALANTLGVTRRSITRTLRAWTKEQLLTKRGGRYILRNIHALSRRADAQMLSLSYKLGERLRGADSKG